MARHASLSYATVAFAVPFLLVLMVYTILAQTLMESPGLTRHGRNGV